MFTDIVGYTALMGKDAAKALELIRISKEIQKPLAEKHGGQWLKEMGDGALVKFTTASDAVKCAIEIQELARAKFDGKLRIGIHLGDITLENNDVYGDGVNVAARLESAADPGGIYVSESIEKAIRGQSDIQSKYLGEINLKNVDYGVRTYAIQGVGLPIPDLKKYNTSSRVSNSINSGVDSTSTLKSSRNKGLIGLAIILIFIAGYFLLQKLSAHKEDVELGNSIAVLYFDNISSDPEQEYFSDGMTEEITAHLSTIKGLRVTSRTSVIQYKGKGNAVNIREIAEALNVDNILEGSVRKAGDKLRITAQLINARTDEHIWTEVYDRDLTDIFKIQSDIAHAIANKFKIVISPSAEERIVTVPTKNIKAYDLYLQAKAIPWSIGYGTDKTGYFKSINLAKQAIVLDPDFAQAYIFLYHAYSNSEDKQTLDSATIFAKEAIIRSPRLPDGYIALAESVPDDDALKWLLKACELDSAMGLLGLAKLYSRKVNLPKAIQCYGQVIKMDPFKQEPYLEKARIYSRMAEEDSLLKYAELANRIAPNSAGMLMANSSARMGRMDANINYARTYWGDDTLNYNRHVAVIYKTARDWRMMKEYYLRTNYREMDWGLVLLKTGSRDSGVLILQKALASRIQQNLPISSLDISRIQSVLGNKAQAILHFRKLIDSGWYNLVWVRKDPYWDYVREEPEFRKIVNELEQKKVDALKQIKEDETKQFHLKI